MTLYLRYSFYACLLLFAATAVDAQSSTWNTNSVKSGAGKQASNAKHKFKDFKEHLQKWGMDTSYSHTFLVGGKLNSDGWSGSMYLMHRPTDYKNRRSNNLTQFWELDFSEIKHEKQTKQQGSNSTFPLLGTATPYVFGKIKNLYTLKLGYGNEELLLPAVMEGNLSVSFRYSGGLSLAMLKPYYLKLIYADYSTTTPTAHIEQHSYNGADSSLFLNTGTILGAAAWSKGLSEINYVPGAYFQAAFAIIPGKNKSFVQVITLGINGALYAEKLPIMADIKAYPWEVSLFAGLAIGKRWK